MSHIFHPDLGDPARPAILVDGCPSCEEHAAQPLDLDREHLTALWNEMVRVERSSLTAPLEAYRSRSDARAGRRLYEVAVFVERYFGIVDPWGVLP